MKVTKKTLKSGLTCFIVPMNSIKSVTCFAMVGVGSRFEIPENNGVSHFLEHMVFKGTRKYPDSKILSSVVDEIGAEFNAFTSKEYTGFYIKSASTSLDLSLDVISQLILEPLLKDEEIEKEKGVILEELHLYEDMPARHVGDVFDRLVFNGSSLEMDIIGTEASIKNMNKGRILEHIKKWYGIRNIVLCVAGDSTVLNTPEIFEKVEQKFSIGLSDREQNSFKETIEKGTSNFIFPKHKIATVFKETQQAHLILGFPGIRRNDSARYALTVLSTLLGGTMSSRLFTELREKRGLCYYVKSDEDLYRDCGVFGARAGVDTSRIDEAVKVLKEQFLDLLSPKAKIDAHEVEKAKNHLYGATVLELEDSQFVAQFYASHQLLHNENTSPKQELERTMKVSLEDVEEVVKKIIKENEIYLAVIGPFKDESKFQKLL